MTPILYRLTRIPYTYFLTDPETREARRAKRKPRKNPAQVKYARKGTGPTRQEIDEAHLRYRILSAIASYGDPDGTRCWASAETIAFDVGCGPRCIAEHKAALEAAGWLVRRPRLNQSDDCTVCIPEHIWTDVQARTAEHAEIIRNRASNGGWRRPKVGAAKEAKVGAAYAADDLSLTSSKTFSLPLATNNEGNGETLKDNNGPKLIGRQIEPVKDFSLRVAKLTENKILFTAGQISFLKTVLSEFTSDELFRGFRHAWDEISEDQVRYFASKFVANAHVQAQLGRDILQKQQRDTVLVAAAKEKMMNDASEEVRARLEAIKQGEAAMDEELPD